MKYTAVDNTRAKAQCRFITILLGGRRQEVTKALKISLSCLSELAINDEGKF